MLRILIDQDFDQDILRGIIRRVPTINALTAYEVGLSAAPDPQLLAWAAENKRVVLTHDRKTMPHHAASRMAAGAKMAGVIIVPRRLPIGQVIDELEMIVTCSSDDEWENIIKYLPF
jgi:hypothetical protein